MGRLCFLLIAFISFSSFGSSGWYLAQSESSVQLWKHHGIKEQRLVVDTQLIPPSQDLSYYNSPAYSQELQLKKSEILTLLKIRDWKIASFKAIKSKDGVVVDFSGSYLDPDNKKISYVERHVYGPARSTQFLLTVPSEKNSLDMPLALAKFEEIQTSLKQGSRK